MTCLAFWLQQVTIISLVQWTYILLRCLGWVSGVYMIITASVGCRRLSDEVTNDNIYKIRLYFGWFQIRNIVKMKCCITDMFKGEPFWVAMLYSYQGFSRWLHESYIKIKASPVKIGVQIFFVGV